MASVSGTMFSTSFLPRKPVVTRLKAIPNVAAGSCSSCAGTVDQSDGNYLDDDQIADEFVQLCSPVLFTHSLMLP
ncbi:Ferredoxin [Capsicum chinense]|nr:Ferredoxin [Capsicum chinense]